MLVETFFAVTCDEADLQDLDYSRIAGQIGVGVNSSRSTSEAGDTDGIEQETDAPPQDAIVSLSIRHSALGNLAGAGAYRSLLALSITHCGLAKLSHQVWHHQRSTALASMSATVKNKSMCKQEVGAYAGQ